MRVARANGKRRRSIFAFACASLLVLLAVPQASNALTKPPKHRASTARARLDTTIAVERGTQLDITANAGRVTVRGWDKPVMEIRAESESGVIELSRGTHTVRVEASRGRRGHSGEVTIRVNVPRGTRVLTNSSSGDVEVLDVGGALDAHLVSGSVRVRGLSGYAYIENVSGDITVNDVEGPVRLSTLSGEITLTNVQGDVSIVGTSSSVLLRDIVSSRVQVRVASGDINFSGSLASTGRYDFATHSGDVRLHLGSNARGSLHVQSFSGELESSLPLVLLANGSSDSARRNLTSRREIGLRHQQQLEFGGGGSAQVTVSTFSGSIHIDRGSSRAN